MKIRKKETEIKHKNMKNKKKQKHAKNEKK